MNVFCRIGSIGLVLVLAGCAGSSGTAIDGGPLDGETEGDRGTFSSGVGDDGLGSGSAFGDDMDGGGDLLDNRVIYFEYDRAEVAGDDLPVIEAHGKYLAANPSISVRLEGHADERGSREYNIGLGERRAQAVRQLLLLQGVAAVQMSTVSYGEERPAVLGGDEESLALNRRVELVYGR